MAAFAAVPDFGERAGVVAFLRFDETAETERISRIVHTSNVI